MGDIIFDNKELKFGNLENKYLNFYAPAFEITINGKDLVKKLGMVITSVSVETKVNDSDSLTFDVKNAYDVKKSDFNWLDDYLAPGKTVEVKMGYSDKLETIFKGFIKSVRFQFPAGENPQVDVTGIGFLFLMTRDTKFRFWENMKYSDVAKDIAGEYSSYIKTCKGTSTPSKIKKVIQNGISDFNLLKMIAERINYEFFVVGDEMYFRKPLQNKTPVVTLTWGKNLRAFSPEIDIGDQIPNVTVRTWDEVKKEAIESKAKDIDTLGSNSKTGEQIWEQMLGKTASRYIYSATATSKEEAEEEATAKANSHAMKLITGTGETLGIPEIRAGRCIKLDGVGKKFSTVFYIVSATHTVNSSGYTTTFSVEGNAI